LLDGGGKETASAGACPCGTARSELAGHEISQRERRCGSGTAAGGFSRPGFLTLRTVRGRIGVRSSMPCSRRGIG